MRVTTWNVNGMRAAIRKGFAEHVEQIKPDVLLLQEIRVTPTQLPAEWVAPSGWHVHWHPAQRLGYAGVAVMSREPIEVIGTGLGDGDADEEGRVLRAKVGGAGGTGGVEVVSVYLPKGIEMTPKQERKERWMASFRGWADAMRRKRMPVVIGGDLNIAHTERDIFYAKANAGTSGFLPQERAWFGDLLGAGWRDLVREHYGEVQGPYSWWSNRGQARQLDRGWRIDYLLANAAAGKRFKSASIHRAGGLTVSDHAPVTVDLDV